VSFSANVIGRSSDYRLRTRLSLVSRISFKLFIFNDVDFAFVQRMNTNHGMNDITKLQ
jgi:hypothetical protein